MALKNDFQITKYDWIGFDMDHCLIRYKIPELSAMIHHHLASYLVEKKSYNHDVLFRIPYDHTYSQKGNILDWTTGDIIKLDKFGRVVKARHGMTGKDAGWLSPHLINERYGCGQWRFYSELEKGVTRNKFFNAFLTYFDLPALFLCGLLVDMTDREQSWDLNWKEAHAHENQEQSKHLVKYNFFKDLCSGFGFLFSPEGLASQQSPYFLAMVNDTKKYIFVRPSIKQWFHKLKINGIRLFLLTDSHVNYSELLMRFAFGNEWRSFFDLIVFYAGKSRGFFENCDDRSSNVRSFFKAASVAMIEKKYPVDNIDVKSSMLQPHLRAIMNKHGQQIRALKNGNAYTEGNWIDFQKSIGSESRVLYMGDSILSDVILPSKMTDRNWEIIPIVEEINNDAGKINWGSFFWGKHVSSKINARYKIYQTYWDSVISEHSIFSIPDIETLLMLEWNQSNLATIPTLKISSELDNHQSKKKIPTWDKRLDSSEKLRKIGVAVASVSITTDIKFSIVKNAGLRFWIFN